MDHTPATEVETVGFEINSLEHKTNVRRVVAKDVAKMKALDGVVSESSYEVEQNGAVGCANRTVEGGLCSEFRCMSPSVGATDARHNIHPDLLCRRQVSSN